MTGNNKDDITFKKFPSSGVGAEFMIKQPMKADWKIFLVLLYLQASPIEWK